MVNVNIENDILELNLDSGGPALLSGNLYFDGTLYATEDQIAPTADNIVRTARDDTSADSGVWVLEGGTDWLLYHYEVGLGRPVQFNVGETTVNAWHVGVLSGKLYVGGNSLYERFRYTGSGITRDFSVNLGSLNGPGDIAEAEVADTACLFTRASTYDVRKYASGTLSWATNLNSQSRPRAIAVDRTDGDVFVFHADGRYEVYNSAGAFQRIVDATEEPWVDGMACYTPEYGVVAVAGNTLYDVPDIGDVMTPIMRWSNNGGNLHYNDGYLFSNNAIGSLDPLWYFTPRYGATPSDWDYDAVQDRFYMQAGTTVYEVMPTQIEQKTFAPGDTYQMQVSQGSLRLPNARDATAVAAADGDMVLLRPYQRMVQADAADTYAAGYKIK